MQPSFDMSWWVLVSILTSDSVPLLVRITTNSWSEANSRANDKRVVKSVKRTAAVKDSATCSFDSLIEKWPRARRHSLGTGPSDGGRGPTDVLSIPPFSGETNAPLETEILATT